MDDAEAVAHLVKERFDIDPAARRIDHHVGFPGSPEGESHSLVDLHGGRLHVEVQARQCAHIHVPVSEEIEEPGKGRPVRTKGIELAQSHQVNGIEPVGFPQGNTQRAPDPGVHGPKIQIRGLIEQ